MFEYREDLNFYNDGSLEIKEALTVGCLGKDHEFSVGIVESEFISKLRTILVYANKSPCQVSVNSIRGYSVCPLCGGQKAFMVNDGTMIGSSVDEIIDADQPLEIRILGNSEIWIPNINEKESFLVTYDLIYHYIVDHMYLPPKVFIDSVLEFDMEGEFIAEREYANCVRKYFPDFTSVAEMVAEELGVFP